MKDRDQNEIRNVLREVFPRMDAELRQDLWPAMLGKLDAQRESLAWYDWALLGILGGMIAIFPNLILVFVYHL